MRGEGEVEAGEVKAGEGKQGRRKESGGGLVGNKFMQDGTWGERVHIILNEATMRNEK